MTEARDRLKGDATGVYNTKAPYGGCGGERDIHAYILYTHIY